MKPKDAFYMNVEQWFEEGTALDAVDKLGMVREEIAHLQTIERKLKSKVEAAMPKTQMLAGRVLFDASLVVQFRETLDMDKVREFLKPQQLRVATRVNEVRSVRVTRKIRG